MAITDRGRMADGITVLNGGMDSGRAPSMLSTNQCAYAGNVTFRGGYAKTRPGFKRVSISPPEVSDYFTERFQGASYFSYGGGQLVVQLNGNTYSLVPPSSGSDWVLTNITGGLTMDATRERVHYVEVGDRIGSGSFTNYLICQDGTNRPLMWNGSSMARASTAQVPIGTGPMAYGQGRLWVAQGRNFVAGDILGGSNGVLKFSENSYLDGGGAFTVPLAGGNITSMRFMAAPNTALGQGELAVLTADAAYSVVVPPDRYDWFAVADPIQRVMLIHNGALSHFSTELVNGDVFFRSRDGIRSVVQAVRDFQTLGNTPLSREMNRVLKYDESKYLGYTSAVLFDNRYLLTSQSDYNDDTGIGFNGLIALDFDLISGMSGKTPPAYDGFWTLDVTRDSVEDRLSFLQLVKGDFNGVERCFAFMRNDDGNTEMWELTRDGEEIEDTDFDDDDVLVPNKITSELETPSFNFKEIGAAKILEGGDLWVDDVSGGTVTFHADFHPDQYPCWVSWQDWSVIAESSSTRVESVTLTGTGSVALDSDQLVGTGTAFSAEINPGDVITVDGTRFSVKSIESATALTLAVQADPAITGGAIIRVSSTCNDFSSDYQPQYRPRMRLGMPSDAEEPATGKPFNYGWEFAARLKWTGHARVKLFRMNARVTEEEPYADVNMDGTSKAIACDCLSGVSNITNQ